MVCFEKILRFALQESIVAKFLSFVSFGTGREPHHCAFRFTAPTTWHLCFERPYRHLQGERGGPGVDMLYLATAHTIMLSLKYTMFFQTKKFLKRFDIFEPHNLQQCKFADFICDLLLAWNRTYVSLLATMGCTEEPSLSSLYLASVTTNICHNRTNICSSRCSTHVVLHERVRK